MWPTKAASNVLEALVMPQSPSHGVVGKGLKGQLLGVHIIGHPNAVAHP